MAAKVIDLFREPDSDLLKKLKEKDMERSEKMIAAFYKKLQEKHFKKSKQLQK